MSKSPQANPLDWFRPDRLDGRRAATRKRCQLCGEYFDPAECEAGVSGICPDCIRLEAKPFQDNDDVPVNGGYLPPRESPEITVARRAKEEAETFAERTMLALLQHHEILSAIAGSKGRSGLGLLPQEQSRLAGHALDMLQQNFPDVAELLGLRPRVESP